MLDRLKNIKKEMLRKNIDAFLVSSTADIAYFTGYSNFSILEREAYLLITKDINYIFTDQRYIEAVTNQVLHFQVIDSRQTSFKKTLGKLIKKHKIKKLGINEDNLTVLEYKSILKVSKNLANFTSEKSRIIKSVQEVKLIEKACNIGDKAFGFIQKKLRIGITEKEIAFELEMFIKKMGASLSFDSIVAFGPNSSIPHHQTGDKKLEKNNFVLLDFGVRINNYCSDMTRTVIFGSATPKQKHIYQTVLDSQQKAIYFLEQQLKTTKPAKASDVDKSARDYIISQKYHSIPHSLGHGIGHEVHEKPWISPKSKDILKPGMVFSIEPGIYIPKFGGVRIEDLYVLEKNCLRQITKSPKETLLEI